MESIQKYSALVKKKVFQPYNWLYLVLSDMYVNSSLTSENMVFPSYNWWYSILPYLYVNSYLICFLDGCNRFTSKKFLSLQLQTFHVTYLYFLTVTNVSLHIPLFLDGYECFTLNPLFRDGYGRFTSKPLLSWQFKMLHAKTPDSTNAGFSEILVFLFLFLIYY